MFRFTIRELVLLTLVVAMGIGWWVERRTGLAWKLRAEATAGQLETQHAVKALFERNGTIFRTENTESFVPHDSLGPP
jgi:hypothetical protein